MIQAVDPVKQEVLRQSSCAVTQQSIKSQLVLGYQRGGSEGDAGLGGEPGARESGKTESTAAVKLLRLSCLSFPPTSCEPPDV